LFFGASEKQVFLRKVYNDNLVIFICQEKIKFL